MARMGDMVSRWTTLGCLRCPGHRWSAAVRSEVFGQLERGLGDQPGCHAEIVGAGGRAHPWQCKLRPVIKFGRALGLACARAARRALWVDRRRPWPPRHPGAGALLVISPHKDTPHQEPYCTSCCSRPCSPPRTCPWPPPAGCGRPPNWSRPSHGQHRRRLPDPHHRSQASDHAPSVRAS